MKQSVKPAAHLLVEWLPKTPWNSQERAAMTEVTTIGGGVAGAQASVNDIVLFSLALVVLAFWVNADLLGMA